MPLFFPDDHRPDLSVTSIVELKCLDADNPGRVVRAVVWDQVIEAHAIAAGWKQPLGNYDRKAMVRDVLDRVVEQASAAYDDQGQPDVIELHKRP
jgi:hypothetical protein